jgi:hypothetical protein
MNQTTFSQWVIRARKTDDAVGDFIGDFRRDKRAPSHFESLARLRLDLHTKNACPRAIEAAAGAWKRYRSWRHKQKSAVADTIDKGMRR